MSNIVDNFVDQVKADCYGYERQRWRTATL